MNKYLATAVVVLLAACVQSTYANNSQDIILSRLDLSDLSKVQRESKVFPLERRCEMFERRLRLMLNDTETNRFQLFEQVAGVLALRKLPFNNDQPFLTALKQCLEAPSQAVPVEGGVYREVIAPPPAPGPPLPPQEVATDKPTSKAIDEFNQVKKNVGQNIHSPKGGVSGGGYKSVYDLDDDDQEDEELHHKNAHETQDVHLGAQHIVQLQMAHRLVAHSLERGCQLFERKLQAIFGATGLDTTQLFHRALNAVAAKDPAIATSLRKCLEDFYPTHPSQSDPHEAQSSVGSNTLSEESVNQVPNEEGVGDNFQHEEIITDGRTKYHGSSTSGNSGSLDQAQKSEMIAELEMSLEKEKKLTEWLRKQLDEGQYEMEELREELDELKASMDNNGNNVVGGSQSPTRGNLVVDDDPIGRARFEELKRLYDQSVAREAEIAEELKSALDRIEQLESSAKQRRHDDDDDRKGNPIEMFYRLREMISSSDSHASRCMKYYLMLTFTGDLNKKVIKTIAGLSLPEHAMKPSGELRDVLQHCADSASGIEKYRDINQELTQCARLYQSNSGSQQVPVYHVNSRPEPEPVSVQRPIAPTRPTEPGHAWSYSIAHSGGPPSYRAFPSSFY